MQGGSKCAALHATKDLNFYLTTPATVQERLSNFLLSIFYFLFSASHETRPRITSYEMPSRSPSPNTAEPPASHVDNSSGSPSLPAPPAATPSSPGPAAY
jgi:hypothetical protein